MRNAKTILYRLHKKLKEDMTKSKKRERIARIAENYDKEHIEHIFQVGLQLAMKYIKLEAEAIKNDEEEAEIEKQIEKLKESEK